jgi:hypothetical protein
MVAVRVLVAVGVAGVVAVLGGSAAAGGRTTTRHFEVAVLATPSAAHPQEFTQEFHLNGTDARHVQVAGATSAASTCDACHAGAGSVQVVYADDAHSLEARNVVTAWATGCRHCSGSAVGVQVVVADRATSVIAANRAFAVAAGCLVCRVTATAVQLVVLDPSAERLPAAALAQLRALRDRLAAPIPTARGAAPLIYGRSADATVNSATTQMTALLRSALGGRVSVHVKVAGG